MERICTLARPELFSLESEKGRTYRGAKQEWYDEQRQCKGACGPATAAVLLAYLAQTRPALAPLYPSCGRSVDDFTGHMEQVWDSVTPGKRGCSLRLFTLGLEAFAGERQCPLHIRQLDIPRFRIMRPTLSQCIAFMRTALAADCPVAFLALSGGRVSRLENGEWVPIIALEERDGGQVICTILKDGRERNIDFCLWYQSSGAGGGLVFISKE